MKLYLLFSSFSWFIRNYYLPNPFESFGVLADLLNMGDEPLIHIITFGIVGLFYKRGEFPLLGSILYLLFYIIHNALLNSFSKVNFSIILIALIICGYTFIINKAIRITNESY